MKLAPENLAPALARRCAEEAEVGAAAMEGTRPATRHAAALRSLAAYVRPLPRTDQRLVALGIVASRLGGLNPLKLGDAQEAWLRTLAIEQVNQPESDADALAQLVAVGAGDLAAYADSAIAEARKAEQKQKAAEERAQQAEERAEKGEQAVAAQQATVADAEAKTEELEGQVKTLRQTIDDLDDDQATDHEEGSTDDPPERRPHPDAEGIYIRFRPTLGEALEIEYYEPIPGSTEKKRRREVQGPEVTLEQAVERRAQIIADLEAETETPDSTKED